MTEKVIGTDVSSVLNAKKRSVLFSKDSESKSTSLWTFIVRLIAWGLAKPLHLISSLLQAIINLEKMLLTLRVDMLKLFYWGRGNSFAVFIQAVVVFIFGIVAFSFVVGNVGTNVANEYGISSVDPVYAAVESDVIIESGSLITLLPKELKRLDTADYIVTYSDMQQKNPMKAIAEKWEISGDSIRWANNMKSGAQPKLGQELKIPPISGSYYTVLKGETLEIVSRRNNLDEATVAELNFLSPPYKLKTGDVILLPGISPDDAKPPKPTGEGIGSWNPGGGSGGSFTPRKTATFLNWPVQGGGSVSRCWIPGGHDGIDISPGNLGAHPTILAAAPGKVTYAGIHCSPGWPYKYVCGGYAWVVEIDHGNGFSTIYGHLQQNSLMVRAGDVVSGRQPIAKMGNTGTVFGNPGTHLHFQLNYSGFLGKSSLRPTNPATYLFASERHGCK